MTNILNVFKIVKKTPFKFIQIIFFGLFIAFAYMVTNGLVNFLVKLITASSPKLSSYILIPAVILFTIMYFLFLILIYSFFKFAVLDFVKNMFTKIGFGFDNFIRFYLLNIKLVIPCGIVFIGFVSLPYMIFIDPVSKYVAATIAFIFIFIFYTILNVAHSMFIDNPNYTLKEIGLALGRKFTKYIFIYLWNLAVAIAYFIFYVCTYYGIMKLGSWLHFSESILAAITTYQNMTFNIITVALFFIMLAFNNLYFYMTIKHKK